MANIANLALKVTADPSGAVRDLSNLQRGVQKTVNAIGTAQPPTTGFRGFIANVKQMFSKLNFSSLLTGGGLSGILVSGGGPFGAIIQGALAAGQAIARMVQQTAQLVDEMAKLSDRLGIAFEDFQALAHAAELAGVSQSQLETSMTMFNRVLGQASRGDTGPAQVFRRLGLDAQALAAMAPDQALIEVSRAISELGNEAERTAAATELFGRSGANMLNFLAEAHTGIAAASADLERMGTILSRDQAKDIERMNDAVAGVKAGFDGIIKNLTAFLAPIVRNLADQVKAIFGPIGRSFQSLTQVAQAIYSPFLAIGRVLTQAMRIIMALPTGMQMIQAALQPIIDGWNFVLGVLEDMQPIFDALTDFAHELGKAFLEMFDFKDWRDFLNSIRQDLLPVINQIARGIGQAARNLKEVVDQIKQLQAGPGVGLFGAGAVGNIADPNLLPQTPGMNAQQIEEAAQGLFGLLQQLTGAFNGLTQAQQDLANNLNRQFQDPMKGLLGSLMDANRLLDQGAISQDVWALSIGNSVSEMERLLGITDQIHLPRALEAGSSEVVSALNQFRTQTEGPQNPQERMANLMQIAQQQREQQIQEARRLAEAMQALANSFEVSPAGV